MLKSWEGQGHMVGWPGCYMTCPGFNMNMVRVQYAVARVKTMHYIEPDPGGPLWLSIYIK